MQQAMAILIRRLPRVLHSLWQQCGVDGEAESLSKGSNKGGTGVIEGRRHSGLLEVSDEEEEEGG